MTINVIVVRNNEIRQFVTFVNNYVSTLLNDTEEPWNSNTKFYVDSKKVEDNYLLTKDCILEIKDKVSENNKTTSPLFDGVRASVRNAFIKVVSNYTTSDWDEFVLDCVSFVNYKVTDVIYNDITGINFCLRNLPDSTNFCMKIEDYDSTLLAVVVIKDDMFHVIDNNKMKQFKF